MTTSDRHSGVRAAHKMPAEVTVALSPITSRTADGPNSGPMA